MVPLDIVDAILPIIESKLDTALATRTEAAAQELRKVPGYRNKNGALIYRDHAQLAIRQLSTSAEQAALEAIKQQVRAEAIREAQNDFRNLMFPEGGDPETDDMADLVDAFMNQISDYEKRLLRDEIKQVRQAALREGGHVS